MHEIFELITDEQWREGLGVLQELRTDLDLETVLSQRVDLIARGYKLFGLFENGQLLCVAGVIVQPHITRINELWVHDLVTVSHARSRGLGLQMMRYLEVQARNLACGRLLVHTRLSRARAQHFYEEHLAYERYALVFEKNLERENFLPFGANYPD